MIQDKPKGRRTAGAAAVHLEDVDAVEQQINIAPRRAVLASEKHTLERFEVVQHT